MNPAPTKPNITADALEEVDIRVGAILAVGAQSGKVFAHARSGARRRWMGLYRDQPDRNPADDALCHPLPSVGQ